MSGANAQIYIGQTGESTNGQLPLRVSLALDEFCRLANEASNYLSEGNLFPGLSSLTGLTPVLGALKDYCISKVVPTEEDDGPRNPPEREAPSPAHLGIYL